MSIYNNLPTMLHVLGFVHPDGYLDFEVVLTVFGGVHAVPLRLTAAAGGDWNHHLPQINHRVIQLSLSHNTNCTLRMENKLNGHFQ